ncbi:carbohydrate ABC transporter permease [Paracoccus aminophilus]|uniref:ABC-type sugar transport systems, permease component n=1 Tax=Paracoccus aminophilus JCM 7686 TaxID=1367847 RepID=S5XQY3_PARAH|nr:sugar ABC transporter permease [Paracoccus aminophilus]AGT09814.1 ABC-type sugar transport systems, permease component [Paracoccus aminophilus JCM 7686]
MADASAAPHTPPAPRAPEPAPTARRGLRMRTKRLLWVWSFLALPVLFYSVIRFYPTIEAFWLSLTNWDLLSDPEYIGLENYRRLFADPLFWQVFGNTFKYLLIGTPVSLVLAFTIAYFLDRIRFGHTFLRALYFLPFITTASAMAWVWRWFYQPAPTGIINNALGQLGISPIPFLKSTELALPSITFTAIWAGLGFQIIIFMAGLRAIPSTYYEAARIDGLNERQILRKITLPLLKPTTVFLVVFSSIGFLRIFDQVFNMSSIDPGGPLNSTKPLVLMIYQTAFSSYEMGYAAAQTTVLFSILLVISLVQLWLMRDR